LAGVCCCARRQTLSPKHFRSGLRIIVAFSTGTAADIVVKRAGGEFNVKIFATDFAD